MLFGIDLGGTKIEGVVLESRYHPNVLYRSRIATEQEGGYLHILNRIRQLLDGMCMEVNQKPKRLGIGTPGTLDPKTLTLKNSNTNCLNGQYLLGDLEKTLEVSVSMANDANCFALAETSMGVVADQSHAAEIVFGTIMGTGVGGGIVVRGNLLNGHHGIAGEWGHNFLDVSGGKCYCGKTGCVETVISGPALQKYYFNLSGAKRDLKEILGLHRRSSDDHASKTISRLTHYFGKAISNIINTIDPDVIVLGGGLGNIDELYTDGVESAKSFVFNNELNTRFLRPSLGDSAGVFGAALLAEE